MLYGQLLVSAEDIFNHTTDNVALLSSRLGGFTNLALLAVEFEMARVVRDAELLLAPK